MVTRGRLGAAGGQRAAEHVVEHAVHLSVDAEQGIAAVAAEGNEVTGSHDLLLGRKAVDGGGLEALSA
jgi:hypothetical protein